jgi:hypothetical protein
MKPATRHLSSDIRKLVSVICHPPSAIFCFLFLVTCYLLFVTLSSAIWHLESVYAAGPTPDPCYVSKPDPLLTGSTVNIPPVKYHGDPTNGCKAPRFVEVTLDFSIFKSLFSSNNSNYLEGKFQQNSHQQENISSTALSNPAKFNYFFGPTQKGFPQIAQDLMKVNYIKYLKNHEQMPEYNDTANYTYTDINGQNPRTIYQMVTDFGDPNPPSLGVSSNWDNTWAKYWVKIPTAANDVATGFLQFGYVMPGVRPPCGDDLKSNFLINVPQYSRLFQAGTNLNTLLLPQSIRYKAEDTLFPVSDKSASANNSLLGLNPSPKNSPESGSVKASALPTCDEQTNGLLGNGEKFCMIENGSQGYCSSGDCSGQVVTCNGEICTFRLALPDAFRSEKVCSPCSGSAPAECELPIVLDAFIPYLNEAHATTTYENVLKNPGFLNWFSPSLENNNGTIAFGNFEEHKKAGESVPDSGAPIAGIATDSSKVLASQSDQVFYPSFIGGTNKFRSFVQFNALSPISGGIGSEVYIPEAKPSITPGPNPSPTPPPPGCDTIAYDGTVGDIQAYVYCVGKGKTEPKTVKPLEIVMYETMANESSGGKQCTVGGCAEIGVFQFIAETWQWSGFAVNEDSGSGNRQDYLNGRTNCWRTPGLDPLVTSCPGVDPSLLNWAQKFGGAGQDGGAWDPYRQVDAAASMMADGQACRWCGYVAYLIQDGGTSYAQSKCGNACSYLY